MLWFGALNCVPHDIREYRIWIFEYYMNYTKLFEDTHWKKKRSIITFRNAKY